MQKAITNPLAENLVKFQIDGPGTIVGVGNANPRSLESYQAPQRKAWQGRCLGYHKIWKICRRNKIKGCSTRNEHCFNKHQCGGIEFKIIST